MPVASTVARLGLMMPDGGTLRRLALLSCVGLAAGACGIGWGLPSMRRLDSVLPAEWIRDPAFLDRLAQGRDELYRQMETQERLPVDYITKAESIPRGWQVPPDRLLNSYRSFFLRSANPDEQKNLTYLGHMKPWKLQFEPYGVGYGGAFIYPLGVYFGCMAAVGIVRVSSDIRTYLRDVRRMARVFVAGRWLNVLCITGCGLALYRMGSRMGGDLTGLSGALLFLASPAAVVVEHTLNPYGWATLWFLLGCHRLCSYLDSGERRDLLLGAGCVGMCIGSSYAFFQTAVVLAAPLFRPRAQGQRLSEAVLWTAEACIVAGVVFVATNPYLILKPDTYMGELVYLNVANKLPRTLGGFWVFVTEFMRRNFGFGTTCLALAATAAAWSPAFGPKERFLSTAMAVGLFYMSGRTLDPSHARHFLPYFALGAVLAARLSWKLPDRRLGWIAACLLLADTGSGGVSYLMNFRQEARTGGTRAEAAAWIADHVPAGRSVGLLTPPQPYSTPPFRFDRYDLVLFTDPVQLRGLGYPDYIVLGGDPVEERVTDFLDRHYSLEASFGPRKLLPWTELRGRWLGSNTEFGIYRRLPS